MDVVRDRALGVEFEIDPRFVRTDAAAEPVEGADAAPPRPAVRALHRRRSGGRLDRRAGHGRRAVVGRAPARTGWSRTSPGPAPRSPRGHRRRTRCSCRPRPAGSRAGLPLHVRYRLTGGALEDASGDVAGRDPPDPGGAAGRCAWRSGTGCSRSSSWCSRPSAGTREREALDLPFRSLDAGLTRSRPRGVRAAPAVSTVAH